jgi:hypothetical protein
MGDLAGSISRAKRSGNLMYDPTSKIGKSPVKKKTPPTVKRKGTAGKVGGVSRPKGMY